MRVMIARRIRRRKVFYRPVALNPPDVLIRFVFFARWSVETWRFIAKQAVWRPMVGRGTGIGVKIAMEHKNKQDRGYLSTTM